MGQCLIANSMPHFWVGTVPLTFALVVVNHGFFVDGIFEREFKNIFFRYKQVVQVDILSVGYIIDSHTIK